MFLVWYLFYIECDLDSFELIYAIWNPVYSFEPRRYSIEWISTIFPFLSNSHLSLNIFRSIFIIQCNKVQMILVVSTLVQFFFKMLFDLEENNIIIIYWSNSKIPAMIDEVCYFKLSSCLWLQNSWIFNYSFYDVNNHIRAISLLLLV